jgi:hypothetical protein
MTAEVKGSPIAQADWARLEKLYTFREPEKVRQYLAENPFLLPLLFEAPPHIHKYFPDVPLLLYVLEDPEIIGYTKLVAAYNLINFVSAMNGETAAEVILEKSEQFGHNWWYKAIDKLPEKQRWRLMFTWDFE